jgi:hypothetical protein
MSEALDDVVPDPRRSGGGQREHPRVVEALPRPSR